MRVMATQATTQQLLSEMSLNSDWFVEMNDITSHFPHQNNGKIKNTNTEI